MTAIQSSLAATGDSSELLPEKGDFKYKLHFSRSSGTLEYDLGFTEGGNVSFMLTGTWTGTVTFLRAAGPKGSYRTVPGISLTANASKVAF